MVHEGHTHKPTDTSGSENLPGLLESHHEAAYGWALSCCASHPGDAADILQNAYQKVLQGRARYSGASTFRTWLFAVIRNTAAEERRKHWIGALRLEKYSRERENDGSQEEAAEPFEDSERATLLRTCLAKLPRRQREVLHLVFYQELTVEAAAEVMRVSVGSARTHYARGKQRLASLLKSLP
jgi:RNA polymerase sigma-70 factor (ECF subfamily)